MSSHCLPVEIRLMILQALVEDDCNLARFATVSREWQAIIEQYTFTRIRLTPSRIAELDRMTCRNRTRIRYLWLCLELERYDCTACAPENDMLWYTSSSEDTLIMTALQDLFLVISTWEPNGSLSLDISVYSTSDSEHWFKYLTFKPDALPKEGSHNQGVEQRVLAGADDHQHQWDISALGLDGPQCAVLRVFATIMGSCLAEDDDDEGKETEWWQQLPLVPAVTHLLLRQQTRRRWRPESLVDMLARIPRLRELHYELWREWDDATQELTDEGYLELLESPALKGLSRLTIFENFNQQYPHAFIPRDCSPIRAPNSALSRALSAASVNLESLSGSFMVDASDFFSLDKFGPLQKWPNLTSLVLTSQLLAPDKRDEGIMDILQAAGSAAIHMPQLETMDIWNGRAKLAALFRYERIQGEPSIITWRGTWDLVLQSSVIQAWEAVTMRRSGYGVKLVYERIDSEDIVSHGDAMLLLKLPEMVIRPISLQQIQTEQSFSRAKL